MPRWSRSARPSSRQPRTACSPFRSCGTTDPAGGVDARGARLVAAGSGGGLVVSGAGGLLGFTSLGQGADLELSEAARTTGDPLAADLVWPRASPIAWVLEGPRLVARDGGTLEEVGALELTASARSLDVEGRARRGGRGPGRGYTSSTCPIRPCPGLPPATRGFATPSTWRCWSRGPTSPRASRAWWSSTSGVPRSRRWAAVARNLGSPSLVLRTSGLVWVVGTVRQVRLISSRFPASRPPNSRASLSLTEGTGLHQTDETGQGEQPGPPPAREEALARGDGDLVRLPSVSVPFLAHSGARRVPVFRRGSARGRQPGRIGFHAGAAPGHGAPPAHRSSARARPRACRCRAGGVRGVGGSRLRVAPRGATRRRRGSRHRGGRGAGGTAARPPKGGRGRSLPRPAA